MKHTLLICQPENTNIAFHFFSFFHISGGYLDLDPENNGGLEPIFFANNMFVFQIPFTNEHVVAKRDKKRHKLTCSG